MPNILQTILEELPVQAALRERLELARDRMGQLESKVAVLEKEKAELEEKARRLQLDLDQCQAKLKDLTQGGPTMRWGSEPKIRF